MYYHFITINHHTFYTFVWIRFSSADDQVVFKQEVILCAISCWRILKAVYNSNCNIQLLLDCLHSIETCISVLDETAVPEQEVKQTFEQVQKVVAACFEVVEKWLKKKLFGKIACYTTTETEKELQVPI